MSPHRRFLLLLVAGLTVVGVSPVRAQAPGLGASIELVDPHAFRVCADPRNLPFSNEAGEGFENKLAQLFAGKLQRPVTYAFYPQVTGFVRNTLNAYKCDVIIGDAQGDDAVQTTNPYYHATYALLYLPGHGLDGASTLEDARLHGKRVGVIAGTPPSDLLVSNDLMTLAKPYPLTVDTRFDSPTKMMVDDLVAGRIDAAVLWGPIAGYYAKHAGTPVTLVPLLQEHRRDMDFRISMGVRHSDQDWKRTLNRLIADNQDAINGILRDYGVPLVDEQGKLLSP